ncbi:hypothetical protein ABT168_28235 [Streptomyces sp. NPDC001793]|uniref:hypothetical protein n=1 Tax=Streptomyces sp. NPDC001793 TaxID=3154657 RepID=UPI00332BCF27
MDERTDDRGDGLIPDAAGTAPDGTPAYLAGRHAPEGSPAHRLHLWIERLHDLMTLYAEQFVHDAWEHDYSARSLPEVEQALLDSCSVDDGDDDATPLHIEAVAAYLGETLLQEAGGRWDWDATAGTDGLPVVRPDPALGHPPVVPLLVVGQALREASGQVLATAARLLRRAVRARQREHPEWWPRQVRTPWVHAGAVHSACRTPERWRNARMVDYLRWWAEQAGGRDRWLFAPASLDAMEALLRQHFRTVEDYDRVADEPFWITAAWYVGQYVVHNKGALWQYREVDPDAPPGTSHAADDPWTGSVFVSQRLRYDGHAEHPWAMLREAVAGQDLREIVDRFPDARPHRVRTGRGTWPEQLWDQARPEHLTPPALPPLTDAESAELAAADDLGDPDWYHNHRLDTWLAARRDAFPAWAEAAGGTPADWDFSPASLDRLEALVRARFTTYEEMVAAKDEPFLAGAAWYLGEVQVRTCGAVWRCRPQPPTDPDNPYDVPMVEAPRTEPDEDEDRDEDRDDEDDEEYVHLCDPPGTLRALLLNGPAERLRDALEAYG